MPGTTALTVSRPFAAYSKVTSTGQFCGSAFGQIADHRSPDGRTFARQRALAFENLDDDRSLIRRLRNESLGDLRGQRRIVRNQHDVLLAERFGVDPFDAQAVRIDVA